MSEVGERRTSPRARNIAGSVVVISRRGTGGGVLVDLSAAGALLRGSMDVAPGERIKLLLHIQGEQPLGVSAVVLRSEVVPDEPNLIATSFFGVADEVQQRLQSLVVAALEPG